MSNLHSHMRTSPFSSNPYLFHKTLNSVLLEKEVRNVANYEAENQFALSRKG